MVSIKYNVFEWSNQAKKSLLQLIAFLIAGCIFIGMAITILLTNGKHEPSYYAIFIYMVLGIGFGLFVFYVIVNGTIKTLEDWQKEKDIKQLDVRMQELKIEEIKLKGEKK